MMLVEQTPVPSAALPVAQFKDHLRLGSGFADDAVQDVVLEAHLRAAMAAIEARTGKALITRAYGWPLTAWRDLGAQVLPVAPVSAITGLSIFDRLDAEEVVNPSRYRLAPDRHRPRLVATGFCLPTIPVGGRAVIGFDAGFGPAWDDVPADLRHATLMLASRFYEARGGDAGEVPGEVVALIQPWRVMRLFGGGAI